MIVKIEQADICIITVNFNGEDDCSRLLESLERVYENVSVVIVDNNSSSKKLVDLKVKFPNIELIFNGINYGFGKANNIGVAYANQYTNVKYVFILNNDTVVCTNTIKNLKNTLQENNDVSCVSPLILEEDRKTIWFINGDFSIFNAGVKSYCKGEKYTGNNTKKSLSPFITGCAMFFNIDVYNTVKGFDENYFMYFEDIDLCKKLLNTNKKIFVDERAVIIHFAHSSIKAGCEFSSPLSKQNPNRLFYIKHVIYGTKYFGYKFYTQPKRLVFFIFLAMKWLKNSIKYTSLRDAKFILNSLISNINTKER
jgi:GT2 family glycosyltransferase